MAMSTFLNVKTPAHERSLKPILKPTSIYTVRSISCFAYKYDELHKNAVIKQHSKMSTDDFNV